MLWAEKGVTVACTFVKTELKSDNDTHGAINMLDYLFKFVNSIFRINVIKALRQSKRENKNIEKLPYVKHKQ